MELLCNIELIKKHELTPTFYVFLLYLYLEEEFPWKVTDQHLKTLEDSGWIKLTPEGPILRGKFSTTFNRYLASYGVESWIEEWRDLWPKGVKTMGRLVRGDKQGCLQKMKSFLKNHTGHSKEDIFNATKIYIFDRYRDNYKAMACADYFISKDNVSILAAYLEDLEDRKDILIQIEKGQGPFHKVI